MKLQELATQEANLLAQIQNLPGSMDEKAQALKDKGIFEAYGKIHKNYASLAALGDIEALKRALFIQWYAVSEPSCFTGIPNRSIWGDGIGLDSEIEREILDLVKQAILTERMDNEFKWMFTWYYQISEYYFEAFWGKSDTIDKLHIFIQVEIDLDSVPLSKDNLAMRGQMGQYWLSILASKQK